MNHLATIARHAAVGLLCVSLGACATMERRQVGRARARCGDQTVQVYFDPQSAELTKEGRAVIAAAAQDARACRVGGVEVIGLADAAGAPGANQELSQKRAASVAAALKAAHTTR